MQLRGNQLFRKRLAGIDVVWVLDVKSELHRRGVSGRNNDVVGGNKINKYARLGSARVPLLSFRYATSALLNKPTLTTNKISR